MIKDENTNSPSTTTTPFFILPGRTVLISLRRDSSQVGTQARFILLNPRMVQEMLSTLGKEHRDQDRGLWSDCTLLAEYLVCPQQEGTSPSGRRETTSCPIPLQHALRSLKGPYH